MVATHHFITVESRFFLKSPGLHSYHWFLSSFTFVSDEKFSTKAKANFMKQKLPGLFFDDRERWRTFLTELKFLFVATSPDLSYSASSSFQPWCWTWFWTFLSTQSSTFAQMRDPQLYSGPAGPKSTALGSRTSSPRLYGQKVVFWRKWQSDTLNTKTQCMLAVSLQSMGSQRVLASGTGPSSGPPLNHSGCNKSRRCTAKLCLLLHFNPLQPVLYRIAAKSSISTIFFFVTCIDNSTCTRFPYFSFFVEVWKSIVWVDLFPVLTWAECKYVYLSVLSARASLSGVQF